MSPPPANPEGPLSDASERQLEALERRIRACMPAGGLAAIPKDLTREALTKVLAEADAFATGLPPMERLAAKTRLFEARRPFYLHAMAKLQPAARHLKVFDTNNSGTLEREEIAFHMQDSFGKTEAGARKFAAMLYWMKLKRWRSVTISKCCELAKHASGSGNWKLDGSLDEARLAENLRFLSEHPDPFSSKALDALIELNTSSERNPGASWLSRRMGQRIAKGEYLLAWTMAGVEREDGELVISEPIYLMNIEGTLMGMLLNPRQEATVVMRWRDDGELRMA
ncbi:hypothetical protein PPSIR1_40685 [Plesiocystis pacifica SIR-1]|uniref:EF-hand domain-containing protein n=1 Tax=Plesiocystis pacifica SIR-1 TaxID=391625 RepID=A6FYR7_9BACT|nr:hypothetical protein [Plesiocystis pacifica]EDM81339.1 hypothetical protein PPSIR1_40685 [Plesiocystis pacifica SIR-1]